MLLLSCSSYYPGTGAATDIGLGRGRGRTINVAWSPPVVVDKRGRRVQVRTHPMLFKLRLLLDVEAPQLSRFITLVLRMRFVEIQQMQLRRLCTSIK